MSEEYVSPLTAKLRNSEPLDLATLARYVPKVQSGRDAEELLKNSDTLTQNEYRSALQQRNAGEDAKERLILIGLPFVKNLAYKEFRRRSAWNSRVPLEEIVQEGIAGFLKGIYAYNVKGTHTSPTNYLGQWVSTEMRRQIEALEHDFAVPYETIERHRKIRAIRSRLAGELGREPTDEEIVEGAANSAGMYGDSKMGRVDKTRSKDAASDRRRVISLHHIQEEKEASIRTGVVRSSTADTDEDNHDTTAKDTGEVIGTEESTDNEVESESMRSGLGLLLSQALDALGAGSSQRDIIARKYGLAPYAEEQSLRDICTETKIPRHKVNKVLQAFTASMSTPGSPFHSLISRMDIDEIEALELMWLQRLLGPWTGAKGYTPSVELTMSLRKPAATLRPRRNTSTRTLDNVAGVIARFECPYHVNVFAATYTSEDDVPLEKACPQCGRRSPRVLD
jgi:RNA polymerase sigma factor (sigma-70 family)